jgi:hypothetical protein
MGSTTGVPARSTESSGRYREARNRSSRRLEKIVSIIKINCESALRTSDLCQMARHIASARKCYTIMLRHSLRFPLSVQDVNEIQNRSVRLELLISRLEARFEAETAIQARTSESEMGASHHV